LAPSKIVFVILPATPDGANFNNQVVLKILLRRGVQPPRKDQSVALICSCF
jgi:hypothetical protein